MTDAMTAPELEFAPEPPPKGPRIWMRDNLFSSPLNVILTLAAVWFLWTIIPPIFEWAFVDAVWSADNRKYILTKHRNWLCIYTQKHTLIMSKTSFYSTIKGNCRLFTPISCKILYN